MADPLSIIASIIAVVGAAEGVAKTLGKIKTIRNAPDELLALINEVSDLKIILSDIQSYVIHNIQRPQISPEELRNISTLINRARDKLLELDQLIQYRLIKPDSVSDQIKVSRREWLRARSTIERFRQSLRDIRLNIVTQMVIMNSSHQSRIGLTIDEIHIISGQLQAGINRSSDRTSQQLDEQSRLLTDILSSQSNLQGLLQLRNSSEDQARFIAGSITDHPEDPSSSVVRIRAYTSQHQRSPCTPYCRCACHNVQIFQSPPWLHKAIGTLFIGYSGYPIKAIQKCTEASCVSQSTFRVYVHYLFPSWFLIKALTITLMSVFLNEISVSLAVRRIVPTGAQIFRLVRQNDIDGIKRLFSMGLASPNDSLQNGQTALTSAIASRNLDVCKFMIQAGGDPHLDDFRQGRGSPFYWAWKLIFTAYDKPDFLEALQGLFPDKSRALEECGFSRFHKIVLGITSNSLEQEIGVGVSDIDNTDLDGSTALIWASRRGDDIAADLLLKAGANVNKINNARSSALLAAVQSKNIRCARLLLKAGANTPDVDSRGLNTLHQAVWYQDRRDIVKSLIEAGVNADGRDIGGCTPLFYSTIIGHVISAEALLDNGVDIDAVDNDGDTPLCESLQNHADDVLKLLLSRGAHYTTIFSLGRSLLHVAAMSGGLRTLRILRDAGLRNIDTDLLSQDGKIALQLAQERINKPEGFLEKFQDLLTDIRIRNAAATTEGSGRSNREVERGRHWWSKHLTRTLSIWTQFIGQMMLVLGCQVKDLKYANHVVSRIVSLTHEPVRGHWVVGLSFVGLFYIYSGLWIDNANEFLSLVWEMVGPGDLQDL